MQIKRIIAAALAFVMLFSLSGCMNKSEEEPNSDSDVMEEDELVIYHNNTELSEGLMALAEEYSRSTGKKVTSQLSSGGVFSEVESGGALFVVDTKNDLSGMHSGGFFADLMNDLGFSRVISKIPAGLQLNSNGLGSYGIPLMLEGYGYIFDREMLGALFGEENVISLSRDLKNCSFTEFEGFCAAVDTYISSPSAAKITVNGTEYTFAENKTGKAANLTGVFSLNYESAEAAKALLSTALAAKFTSRYDIISANETAIGEMKDLLSAFTEVLDLHTKSIAGAEGSISRGEEFSGGDYNYSTAIDLFTRGNALFYPGGTSDAADFEKSSAGFGTDLDIMPFKLPISENDITASGMSAEKLNSSIVIGSRYYLAVNPNASKELSSAAKDFISWLYEDDEGKTAYSSAFGSIPHSFEYTAGNTEENTESRLESENSALENSSEPGIEGKERAGIEKKSSESLAEGSSAEENPMGENEETPGINTEFVPSHRLEKSLTARVAEYYASGSWVPDMSIAFPGNWSEDVLAEELMDFFGMETWSDDDRKGFINELMEGWKDRMEKDEES